MMKLDLTNQKILITGGAGFIGFHLCKKLLSRGAEIYAFDSINDYYDVRLKYGRLEQLGIFERDIVDGGFVKSRKFPSLHFAKGALEDESLLTRLFEENGFDIVINLAAQAGVRYSLENPMAYINSNIVGFTHILEGCRHFGVKHLVYASSSSVYGLNKNMPFSVHNNVDHPVSLYAASKKSNELMAHTYSHLFNLPTTGLRFFTVYGPWGRPDMALFLFTRAILEGKPIDVYNHGKMERDFTYIDDIVQGIEHVVQNVPTGNPTWSGSNPDPGTSSSPYRVYNIGNSNPVKLLDFVEEIEKQLGKTAKKNMMDIQPGDVPATWADVSDLEQHFDYKPGTPISTGIENFVKWYKEFYGIENK